MNYERETEKGIQISREAGALALQYFDQATPAEEKSDFSPVTIADRECERLIARRIQESFEGDGILGEEGSLVSSRTGRRWLIDPIDGTRDFVRRNSFWAVQLSLQVDNQVVLGIIFSPCTNELLFAANGTGCYWNDTRVKASGISSIDKSILMVSGFKAAWNTWPAHGIRLLTETCWTVRCYGGCYDVIMLARGKADIWLSGSGMEWDYAPAQVIARECGAGFLTRAGDDRIDAKNCVMFASGIENDIRTILDIPEPRRPLK